MMLAGFFLLLLTGGTTLSSELQKTQDQPMVNQSLGQIPAECSYHDVLNYLNLTKSNDMYAMSRPIRDHKRPTLVYLNMGLHAILDVSETDQTLKTYIWIYMKWANDFTKWNETDFCGLQHILVPKEALWMPDLNIEEMIEKSDSRPSPYLSVWSDGMVKFRKDEVVVSTCRMRVYKFPFDTQSCNISFKSLMLSDKEIELSYPQNKTVITERSRRMMKNDYEWVFVDMDVNRETFKHFDFYQQRIVYTITMERRSVLYIANFLLPVFFFLCLDMASFLISDTGGEKLSYKVTVLLAVTVMQLILNDILPSSSNRIPLIAVYCIGIFSLMLLSLLETILVMYLIEKDSTTQDNETDGKQNPKGCCRNKQVNCFRGMKQCTHCASVSDVSADETPSVNKEGSSCQLTNVSLALEKVSDELDEIEQRVSQLSSGKDDGKPGYWTELAKKINTVFIICYVTATILFLVGLFSAWGVLE